MNEKLWNRFKWIGIAEAISFILLLGIAMPLKYMAGMPKAVSVTGMAHGLLFIAYLYVAYACYQEFGWSFKKLAAAFIAAFLPFGPFVFHSKLEKERVAAKQ